MLAPYASSKNDEANAFERAAHEQVWSAIDALARRHGISVSALARRSGLDATTFNVSKRISSDGKMRWPSSESIIRALKATKSSMQDFAALMGDTRMVQSSSIPLVSSLNDISHTGEAPANGDSFAFHVESAEMKAGRLVAVEIAGNAYEPIYRDGAVIVVALDAEVRRGDRIVIRGKENVIAVLQRMTTNRVVVAPAGIGTEREISMTDVSWIGRIVWASQ